jgi:hypothetical protein
MQGHYGAASLIDVCTSISQPVSKVWSPYNVQIIVQHGAFPLDFKLKLGIFMDAIHFLLDVGVRPVDLNSAVNWFNYLWTYFPLRENIIKLMARLADAGVVFDLNIDMSPFLKQNLRLILSKYGECMMARVCKHLIFQYFI